MRALYQGIVLDWTSKTSKPSEFDQLPRRKVLKCRASDEREATYILNRIAEAEGFALGGVQDIAICGEKPAKAQPRKREKNSFLASLPQMSLEEAMQIMGAQ